LGLPPVTWAATSVVRGMKPVLSNLTRSYMKDCDPSTKSNPAKASRIATPSTDPDWNWIVKNCCKTFHQFNGKMQQ
jgi:hypothetical protein